jgi:hypothetical protein
VEAGLLWRPRKVKRESVDGWVDHVLVDVKERYKGWWMREK